MSDRALAWQDDAACRGMPLDAFFPMTNVVPEGVQATCSRCPVRLRCADYGRDQTHGVWGGLHRGRGTTAKRRKPKPPVPEHLQAVGDHAYRLQRTTDTTTTTPTEARDMTAKTTSAKTAPTPDTTTDESRSKSTVAKEGSHKCPTCKTTKPVTKYPTVRNAEGEYVRSLDECRECRDARRVARKAEREAAKATAA